MSSSAEDAFAAADFVYGGLRQAGNGSLLAVIREVKQGRLGERMAFKAKAVKCRSIGGIYRGALFTEGSARNLDRVTLAGSWPDTAAVMGWQAEHDQAEADHRAARLERDARKVSEIERAMLPLRKLYARYGQTRDRAGQAALEATVLRALHTPPRQDEQDK
jgi:hypothetical protein